MSQTFVSFHITYKPLFHYISHTNLCFITYHIQTFVSLHVICKPLFHYMSHTNLCFITYHIQTFASFNITYKCLTSSRKPYLHGKNNTKIAMRIVSQLFALGQIKLHFNSRRHQLRTEKCRFFSKV